MKTDPIRLACLFYETGMIDSDAFAQCSAPQQEQGAKSILSVLNQEASAKTFRDLLSWTTAAATATLTMEIDLPFAGKHKEVAKAPAGDPTPAASSLHRALSSQPLFLTEDQCRVLLNAWKPDMSGLLAALGEAGVLADVPDAAEKFSKGEDAYDRLVETGCLSVSAVNRAAAGSSFKKMNRLFLSLSMLRRNEILTQDDCNAILTRIQEQGFGAIPKLNEEVKHFIAVEPDMPEAHIRQVAFSTELLDRFPETFIRQNVILPLQIVQQPVPHLEIAISDPFYVELTDTLALLIGMPVVGYFAPGNDIISRINDAYAGVGAVSPAAQIREEVVRQSESEPEPKVEAQPVPVAPKREVASPRATPAKVTPLPVAPRHVPERMADSYSAVEMVSSIIENGIEHGATDIHLEPQDKELRVRYRVDGRLRTITRVPSAQVLPVTSRIKVLAALDVTERRRPQDGHFSLRIGESAFDFRISTLPTRDGEKTVIRVLDERRVLHNLESLGVPGKQSDIIRKWISRPHGLVLVTGPTGSGKTSTLYAALNTVNNEDRNIVTIEDPVEYHLAGINQVQVESTFNLTFAEGLRSILRQDPDIIMVGEIRDPETARIAMRAALTGHLVFSTLHTNTAAGAIATLMNMGIEPYMLTSAISGIISQRLIRCLCTECKKSGQIKQEQMKQLKIENVKRKKVWHAVGCPACLGSGYKGRTGIYEIMPMTSELTAAILANKSESELVGIMRSSGFGSLIDGAVEKMVQGITSPEEILDSLALDE